MLPKLPKSVKIISIFLLGIAVAGGIFYYGFVTGQEQAGEQPRTTSPTNIGINGNLDIFWDSWRIVKEDYFNADELDDQELIYGASEGLVKSLNDPYSVFLRPSDAEKFEEDVRGSFGGIGAEIGIRNNKLVIVAPLKDTPADKAGLKSNDHIAKIDDTFTNDLGLEEAVKLIRGEKGTTVVLTILRESWEEPREFPIVRDTIIIPTLDWEMKENDIVHIRLYNFNENAPSLFFEAAVDFLTQGTRGVVLDLRNNPGGYLEVAVNIAGWFIDKGEVVVREKFSSGQETLFRTNGNSALKDIPLVILINGGSASASEILAGALRDHKNTALVGEKTFGKGTVQALRNLDDGSGIKISIAQWLLPKGGFIEKVGLSPDFEIAITEEDAEAKLDPQLEKALEILEEEGLRTPIFKL